MTCVCFQLPPSLQPVRGISASRPSSAKTLRCSREDEMPGQEDEVESTTGESLNSCNVDAQMLNRNLAWEGFCIKYHECVARSVPQ